MSAKWVRSKQWDDQHIPAWAWPLSVAALAVGTVGLATAFVQKRRYYLETHVSGVRDPAVA